MKTPVSHTKIPAQKIPKSVDVNNNPTTPCTSKTLSFPSPMTTCPSKNTKKPPQGRQLFQSPPAMVPYNSPKGITQQSQRNLHTVTQTPCIHASLVPQKRTADDKTLSPNVNKNGTFLLYVPTAANKKKVSPKPVKVLELHKALSKGPREGGDFSISSRTMAAKMQPDRCSMETNKVRELVNKQQNVGVLTERRKVDNRPVKTEGNLPSQNDMIIRKKEVSLQGKPEIELDLSPISKRKEDFSSFLSEKEKLVCLRHPRKKAKYRVFKHEGHRFDPLASEYCCSACAIELAMQGFPIEKLTQAAFQNAHTRTNTEIDEKVETEPQCPQGQAVVGLVEEFSSKVDEAMQHISVIEDINKRQKEEVERKLDMAREMILTCSENVIMLFREETEKAIQDLNREVGKQTVDIDVFLKDINWFTKGFIDLRTNFESTMQRLGQKRNTNLLKEAVEGFFDQFCIMRDELTNMGKPKLDLSTMFFEGKVEQYKRGLKAVLKEVIVELDKEDPSVHRDSNVHDPLGSNEKQVQDQYDENMLKNLGAFEDFLRADENEDVLQMMTVKGKPGNNMVISFGNKEIFEKVLHNPRDGHTLCSTQGETIVVPVLEEMSNGVQKLRESRSCVIAESTTCDNNNKQSEDNIEDEEYENMSNLGKENYEEERDIETDDLFLEDGSHSPEFKVERKNSAGIYCDY